MVDGRTTESHEETLRLDVSGMHCGSCSALIEEVLGDVAGVGSVEVDLESATGTIRYDPTTVGAEELCAVIGDLGYQATTSPAPPLDRS